MSLAAVLQTELFLGIAVLHDVEGRRLGFRKDPGVRHAHFDRACGKIGVHRAAAHSDLTGRRDYELRAHLFRLAEILLAAVRLFIDQLDQAAPVPQIHKHDSALVSLLGDPSHHCHCLSDILLCQLGTPACAVQPRHTGMCGAALSSILPF